MLALAGRRIDPAGAAVPRFPLENATPVRRALKSLMAARQAGALVSSAAAGADLLALDAALELGLRVRVVLPCHEARFRERSVTDRPGDFGPLFDAVVAAAAAAGDLVVLAGTAAEDAAYAACNSAVLDEAAALAAPHAPVAVAVWEGQERGANDLTAAFIRAARQRGWALLEVSTTRPEGPAARRTR